MSVEFKYPQTVTLMQIQVRYIDIILNILKKVNPIFV